MPDTHLSPVSIRDWSTHDGVLRLALADVLSDHRTDVGLLACSQVPLRSAIGSEIACSLFRPVEQRGQALPDDRLAGRVS